MIDDYLTILCEGDENSLDYRIYSKVFEDKTIIPCGSNSVLKVKELKHKDDENTCAITDRDVLSQDEIDKYREQNIFTLKVRAVENLLVSGEILELVCEKLGVKNYKEEINNIKNILFNKYGKRLNKQFEIDITKENILEFYDPKKVIDTVSVMLNLSKNEYIKEFFELLNDNSFKKKVRESIIL